MPFDEALVVGSQGDSELVELDEALKKLALIDERKSRVVELRFFGGLDVRETAAVLNVCVETVMRDWKLAKVWPVRELRGGKKRGA